MIVVKLTEVHGDQRLPKQLLLCAVIAKGSFPVKVSFTVVRGNIRVDEDTASRLHRQVTAVANAIGHRDRSGYRDIIVGLQGHVRAGRQDSGTSVLGQMVLSV